MVLCLEGQQQGAPWLEHECGRPAYGISGIQGGLLPADTLCVRSLVAEIHRAPPSLFHLALTFTLDQNASTMLVPQDWGTKLFEDGLHFSVEGNQVAYKEIRAVLEASYPDLR